MEKESYTELLKRYRDGNCSPDEVKKIEQWYNLAAKELETVPFNPDLIIEEQARLEQLWPVSGKAENKILSFYRTYKSYGLAAILFICASLGIYLMIVGRNDTTFGGDAEPGKNKAVITLADGTKINVSDAKEGELAATSGIQVTKTGKGEVVFKFLAQTSSGKITKDLYNTIETPAGGEYKVCLPDGSNVWLNASSTLKFPSGLAKTGNREVQLSGEAYFEIFKDKTHPFIVSTANQQVQVLGTHFNVSGYPDDKMIKTTLLEGSVSVRQEVNSKNPVILKPNQEAVNIGSSITVSEVDSENAIAWHKGRFAFNEEPLENIMKKISRWYGMKVVYQNNEIKSKTFGGSVSRYSKVSEVLCLLELTKKVKFTIKGKEITVMD